MILFIEFAFLSFNCLVPGLPRIRRDGLPIDLFIVFPGPVSWSWFLVREVMVREVILSWSWLTMAFHPLELIEWLSFC